MYQVLNPQGVCIASLRDLFRADVLAHDISGRVVSENGEVFADFSV